MESKYSAVLQMYGEKAEEAEELKMDLQDIKNMYKQQVSTFLFMRSIIAASFIWFKKGQDVIYSHLSIIFIFLCTMVLFCIKTRLTETSSIAYR